MSSCYNTVATFIQLNFVRLRSFDHRCSCTPLTQQSAILYEPAVMQAYFKRTHFPDCFTTSQMLSQHPNSPPNLPLYSTMPTPSNTLLLPHSPAAPVPMPITTDCDPLMPMLRLPPAIAATQNVLLPATSSTASVSSVITLQHPQSLNPEYALVTGEQQYPMTETLHSRLWITQQGPTHHRVLSEFISNPNPTQERVLPPQSPGLPANLSVAQAQELQNEECVSSQADQ